MTNDLMKPFYNLSRNISRNLPFPLEDIYVGLVARKLNTSFNELEEYWITIKDSKKQEINEIKSEFFFCAQL